MKIISLLLMLSLPTLLNAQYVWSNPSPSSSSLYGVHFLNENNGWVVGSLSTILKTTDGGESWEPKEISLNSVLRKVHFEDENNGWIIGGEERIQYLGSVLVTTDGGENWTNTDPVESYTSWNDISVVSKDLIFICGFHGVYKSIDGGFTWEKNTYLNWASTIYFIDQFTGWAAGTSGGGIYKTTDGGNTWTEIANMGFIWHNSIKFVTEKIGYLVSSELQSETGYIYKTVDGGNSWLKQDSVFNQEYKSIDFSDSLNGVATGTKGRVKYTTDGGNLWLDADLTNNDFNGVTISNGKTWIVGGEYGYGRIFVNEKNDSNYKEKSKIFSLADLNSIEFIDDNFGYASGGAILKTTNSGKTWEDISLFNIEFYSMCILNRDFIALAGRLGEFVKSTDAGESWSITSPFTAYTYTKMKFFTPKLGVALSQDSYLQKTLDGGSSWEKITEPGIGDFYFADSLFGWLSRSSWDFDYAEVYKTTDGGKTWNYTEQIKSIYNMYFLNDKIGWTISNNQLLKTTDSGDNWEIINYNLIQNVKEMIFADENNCYFLIEGINTSLNSIYHSNDGGITLYPVKRFAFLETMALKGNYLWCVGRNGNILKVKTDKLSNITEEALVSKFILYQNYPNPFNPETRIKYEIPQSSFVELKIYNILGEEVAILVNEFQNKGAHEVSFRSNYLSSGIYFYRLSTGDYNQIKKMILIK